jgi:hypothetical protein
MNSKCKIFKDGHKQWYLNGKLHREDDLPAIEYTKGSKEYYLNGKPHRENGPAFYNIGGRKDWFLDGICLNHTYENI